MYQALVIKPELRKEQRVVLLEPPLRNPGTLGLALNSQQYDQFFSCIFSGTDEEIKKTNDLLDGRDWQFNTYQETQKLYEAVKKFLKEDCNCAVTYEHIPKSWQKIEPNDKAMRVYKGLDMQPMEDNMHTVITRDDVAKLEAYASTCPMSDITMPLLKELKQLEAQQQKITYPSMAKKPKLMNPKAEGEWIYVMENFKSQIYRYGQMKSSAEKSRDKKEYARMIAMWRASLYLFKRKCIKDGIPPYTVSDSLSTHYNKPTGFGTKMKTSYHNGRGLVKVILDTLRKSGRVDKQDPLKYDEVGKSNARYYISVYINAKIAKGFGYDEIHDWLIKQKQFLKGKGFVKKSIDSMCDVIIQPWTKRGMEIFITLYFTNDQVKMMLGTQAQTLTPASTLRALRKVGMTLQETGDLIF
jgi:hypothetical protein